MIELKNDKKHVLCFLVLCCLVLFVSSCTGMVVLVYVNCQCVVRQLVQFSVAQKFSVGSFTLSQSSKKYEENTINSQ